MDKEGESEGEPSFKSDNKNVIWEQNYKRTERRKTVSTPPRKRGGGGQRVLRALKKQRRVCLGSGKCRGGRHRWVKATKLHGCLKKPVGGSSVGLDPCVFTGGGGALRRLTKKVGSER